MTLERDRFSIYGLVVLEVLSKSTTRGTVAQEICNNGLYMFVTIARCIYKAEFTRLNSFINSLSMFQNGNGCKILQLIQSLIPQVNFS